MIESTRPLVSTITACYRASRYLKLFLDRLPEQTIFDRLEIVIDHNEPTGEELQWVSEFMERHPGRIRHVVSDRVRPLGESWNQCVKHARGEYLAIWSVDDLRTPESLEAQVRALEANKGGIAYGDYLIVSRFGDTEGQPVSNKSLPSDEHRRGMTIGPFFMFRKELCDAIGLFDEQLRSGMDFDFALRALSETTLACTSQMLGYYLNEGLGASTRPDSLQWVEKNVIYMRYGVWDKLEIAALPFMRSYDPWNLVIDGKRVPVAAGFRDYERTMKWRDERWLPLIKPFATDGNHPMRLLEALKARARTYGLAIRAASRVVTGRARGT